MYLKVLYLSKNCVRTCIVSWCVIALKVVAFKSLVVCSCIIDYAVCSQSIIIIELISPLQSIKVIVIIVFEMYG